MINICFNIMGDKLTLVVEFVYYLTTCSSPVLSLLKYFHRVQTTGLLNGCNAVLFLVQGDNGRGLRRVGQVPW